MKKAISILMIAAMLLTAIAAAPAGAVQTGGACDDDPSSALSITGGGFDQLLGDTDCDNSITIMDATAIRRDLADVEKFTEVGRLLADADADGDITILDATSIQRYLAGLTCPEGIGKPIPRQQARITFIDDDGYKDAMKNWVTIYEKTGVVPTVSLITGRVGQNDWTVSWEDVDRLKDLGFEFVSHSHNHIKLAESDEKKIRADLAQSLRCMEEHGLNTTVLVYPYIAHNELTDAIVRDYFDYGVTSNNLLNEDISDPYDIKRVTFADPKKTVAVNAYGTTYQVHPAKSKEVMHALIDEAVEKGAWLIFMCHFRNSYSDGYYFDEAMMDSVLDTIGYAESKGVVIDTFGKNLSAFEK